MKNTGIDSNESLKGKPDFKTSFYSLESIYNDLINELGNTSINEQIAPLDNRLTKGEIKEMFLNTFGTSTKEIVIDGETMREQSDWDQAMQSLPGAIDGDKDDIVCLGFEYALSHYTQGMPISEVDKLEAVRGYWGTDQPVRTKYMHAFTCLLYAYTEAARAKGLLNESEKTSTPSVDSISTSQHDDKTY